MTDLADPVAGTDPTLQASDTGHSGYYSIALKVTNITGLDAVGGVLLHGRELQATAAGLLDHLSPLPKPDALGFRGSLWECSIEMPGDGIGQGSLAHGVSFQPLGRG